MKKVLIFLVVVISALLCCGCVNDEPAVIKGDYIRTSTDAESYTTSSEGYAPYFYFYEDGNNFQCSGSIAMNMADSGAYKIHDGMIYCYPDSSYKSIIPSYVLQVVDDKNLKLIINNGFWQDSDIFAVGDIFTLSN